MPPHPRLRVRRAIPRDAAACQEIRYTAFRPGPMSRCIWPGDMSLAAMEHETAGFRKDIEAQGQGKTKCHVIVAELLPADQPTPVDREGESTSTNGGREVIIPTAGAEAAEEGALAAVAASKAGDRGPEQGLNPRPRLEVLQNPETGGTVVAFAKWHFFPEGRPESEWNDQKPATVERYGEGADLAVCDAFLGALRSMRQKHINGQPHCLLSLIACSPNHQRLGAATALIQWGTTFAYQNGLTSWLEASPPGYPVYVRAGFRDVAVLDLNVTERWGIVRTDSEDWGVRNALDVAGKVPGDGWFRTVLMNRQPIVGTTN